MGMALDDPRCVLHHCDNPPCFNPAHLYIGTKVDNARDCARRGRKDVRGERNPHHKITAEDARMIRSLLASGDLTQEQVGRMFDVPQSHVSRINRRLSWSEV
jgi:hypothetical protein